MHNVSLSSDFAKRVAGNAMHVVRMRAQTMQRLLALWSIIKFFSLVPLTISGYN